MYLARQAYFPIWGTCWESVAGGHHFRAWRQNGTHADSGAWFIGCVYHPLSSRWPRHYSFLHIPLFLFIDGYTHICANEMYSASKEQTSQKRHKISKDGYNLGRDWFVERALAGSHWKGHNIWWRAEVEWRTGLLESGSKGASYPRRSAPGCFLGQFLMRTLILSLHILGVNHGIPQDGRVAILTVFRV